MAVTIPVIEQLRQKIVFTRVFLPQRPDCRTILDVDEHLPSE